jgi:signal transduction histidine kinase
VERELAVMRDMVELVHTDVPLSETLRRITQRACELLRADNGTIGLVDPSRQSVTIHAAYRMPEDEVGSTVPIGVGLAGRVLETREPVILGRYGDLDLRARWDLDENSVLGVPIFDGGEVVGAFGLGACPPKRLTMKDADRLAVFARYAAMVIRHKQLDQQSRRTMRELRLLYDTSRSISHAIEIGDVVSAYLDQVAARGQFACSIVLYEGDEIIDRAWNVQVGCWSPQTGSDLNPTRIPHQEDFLDRILDTGDTVAIPNVHVDPRVAEGLRAMQRESGRPALALVPLMVHGRRIGLVVLAADHERQWTAEELEPYEATAYLLASAIDSRREHWTAVEQGRELTILKERQRLARDLHDSVSQTLFGVLLTAQSAAASVPADQPNLAHKLDRLTEMSRLTLGEMRSLLAELSPDTLARPGTGGMVEVLRKQGLVVALERFLKTVPPMSPPIEIDPSGYTPQGADVETTLFRLAQEAIANALKHSSATSIQVCLRDHTNVVELTVSDNGVGFDPQEARGKGYGMTSMADRVRSMKGSIEFCASPGGGTTVRARVPKVPA